MTEPEQHPFFAKLTKEDQEGYRRLKKSFSKAGKIGKGQATEIFLKGLEDIRMYVFRKEEDWQIRAYICGIVWYNNLVAVFVKFLAFLLCRSKSSVNDLFNKLNFGTVPPLSQDGQMMRDLFPALNNDPQELRHWTVRALMPGADGQQPLNENIFEQAELAAARFRFAVAQLPELVAPEQRAEDLRDDDQPAQITNPEAQHDFPVNFDEMALF